MLKQLAFSLFLLSATLAFSQTQADYHVVPLPEQITLAQGKKDLPFMLNAATRIAYPAGDDAMQRNAAFLADYVQKATVLSLATTSQPLTRKDANVIELRLDPTFASVEGYQVQVSGKRITVTGATAQGVFYGVQMLRKSLPYGEQGVAEVTFPAGLVQDQPQYGYRGMHLDCARTFFDVDFVKEYIDLLALHQMNVFHWHLTDDQGWRVEIKKYPRLTEVGSIRKSTVIGHNTDVQDHRPYGGYYTQQQIREVVQYAQERYIEVIPELDMPGHMLAALAAYPELGCTGGPYEVGTLWGVFRDIFCAGNEQVYTFVQDVLDEVVPLFPSRYFHIGGDESPRDRWQQCPRCQAKIAQEGLRSDERHSAEDRLQSYFTRRVEAYLNQKGKSIIGWDEILEGDILPTATIMSWRGMEGAIEGSKQGHDVILAPTSHCYFDYRQQANWEYEPLGGGSTVTVEQVYSLDMPSGLSPEQQRHILGVQANLWSEYMTTPGLAEYHVLPRMAALCEVQWLPAERKDYADFHQRCLRLMHLYDAYGWEYARHIVPGHVVEKWIF